MRMQLAPPQVDDKRPVVTLHSIECRNCTWDTGPLPSEDANAVYDSHLAHFRATGHARAWHYTIQRGELRVGL